MITFLNTAGEHWYTWQIAMLWQTAALIAIIWGIDLLIHRWAHPQVRYALWMLVLVKLLIPPTWTSPASVTSHIPGLAFRAATVMERESIGAQGGTEAATGRERMDTQNAATDRADAITSTGVVSTGSVPAMERVEPGPEGQNTIAAGATPGMSDSFQSSPNGATQNSSPPAKGQYPEGGRGFLSWQVYAMFTWLAGIIVLSTWLILRLSGLRREHLTSGAAALPERFYVQLEDVAQKLNLKRIPRVVLTDKVACPAVFGVFRPVLLMPAAKFKSMSARDTEHILLHELAHIKRGDLLVHAVYMLVQIVYWFNPLLWMIRRTLQNLRELCCDATVAKLLRENTCHYRQTLLDTARQLLAEPVDPGLGLLGLFENSNWLVTRLKWLEKNTWKHRPLRIATVVLLVSVMAACVLPMASQPDFKVTGTVTDAVTGEPVAGVSVYDDGYNDNQHRTTTDEEGSFMLLTANEEHNITAKADGYESQTKTLKTWPLANNKDFSFQLTQNSALTTQNYTATLPNGVTVELLGVCEHPSFGKQWWLPNGEMLNKRPYPKMETSHTHPDAGRKALEAAIQVHGSDAAIGFRVGVTGSNGMGSCGTDKRNLYAVSFDQPENAESTDINVGIAAGPWRTESTQKADFSGVYSTRGVIWHGPVESGKKTVLNFAHTLLDKNVRVVAIDKNGKEHTGGSTSSQKAGMISVQTNFRLPLSKIKEFRSQTRDYEQFTFKSVSLRPGGKREVEIEQAEGTRQKAVDQSTSSELRTENSNSVPSPPASGERNESKYLRFGPVIEKIIFSSDIGKDFFFDIDNNKTFTPPSYLTRSSPPKDVIQWSFENGIDILNDDGRFELTPQTVFVKVQENLWEASFDETKNAVKTGFPEKYVIPPHGEEPALPLTYAFETREDGIGLMQILEIKNGNIKIRFKMAQKNVALRPGGEMAAMAGTWYFDNPRGDNEQMAVYPDGKVVVWYSNGHIDRTDIKDGAIELGEYDDHQFKLTMDKDGLLLQTGKFHEGSTIEILSTKKWQRIHDLPQSELLRPLTDEHLNRSQALGQRSQTQSHEFMLQQREILQRKLQDTEKLYAAGRVDADVLYQAKIDLLRNKKELAETHDQRADIQNQVADLCRQQRDNAEKRFTAGQITKTELDEIRLRLLEIEREIREQSNLNSPRSAIENQEIPLTEKSIHTLEFKKERLFADALGMLSRILKVNIVPSQEIIKNRDVIPATYLYDVTFEEALKAICGTTHTYEIKDKFVYVYTNEEYKAKNRVKIYNWKQSHEVFDLATGQMIECIFDQYHNKDDQIEYIKRLDKGDLLYNALPLSLTVMRKGHVSLWDGKVTKPIKMNKEADGLLTVYHIPKPPCRLLVTTAEGRQYDVKINSSSTYDGKGRFIKIEYELLNKK